jgi:hypothetical protein
MRVAKKGASFPSEASNYFHTLFNIEQRQISNRRIVSFHSSAVGYRVDIQRGYVGAQAHLVQAGL